jgi:hypothetical protein
MEKKKSMYACNCENTYSKEEVHLSGSGFSGSEIMKFNGKKYKLIHAILIT